MMGSKCVKKPERIYDWFKWETRNGESGGARHNPEGKEALEGKFFMKSNSGWKQLFDGCIVVMGAPGEVDVMTEEQFSIHYTVENPMRSGNGKW